VRCFVTGAAGFVGSSIVDRLLGDGHLVVGYDNFSTGREQFLGEALASSRFTLVRADTLDLARLTEALAGCEMVFHFAANADVRFGPQHPRKDLEQNTLATFNVLEAMRANGIRRIVFSSTGSIYGEPAVFPTPEDAPFPIQTSLYGASKLAGEGLIEAYVASFGFQGLVFRFVSLMGERYSHGHVVDFYTKLRARPDAIEVLGNGQQRKSYLYIQDCLDAMLLALQQCREPLGIFNLGTDEHSTVDDSLDWICDELGVSPVRHYTGGERGWIGDSPFIFLDCSRIRALGWRPTKSIREAVRITLRYLQSNAWLFERRP
jgi:UDP-glucose 4-epimerase